MDLNPKIREKILGGEAVEIKTEERSGGDSQSTEIVGYLRSLQCGIGASMTWTRKATVFETTIHVPTISDVGKRERAIRFMESSPLNFQIHQPNEKPA